MQRSVDRIFQGQTVGRLLGDPDLRFAIERALRRDGYDLIMPPDLPDPGDEFLNAGVQWCPVTIVTYDDETGYGRNQFIARRLRSLEDRELDRQAAFFFAIDHPEIPDGWVVQILTPGSYQAHGTSENSPGRLMLPQGLETIHYRYGIGMPDDHVRLLYHHDQVGLEGDKYIEVDVPMSAIALFNYECDPVSGVVMFRVYRSGHRELV